MAGSLGGAMQPMLVTPAKPTPYEVLELDGGSVMAGLSTLTSSHVVVLRGGTWRGWGEAAEAVKAGLAQVLVPYYPLAGRILQTESGWMLECDGRGAIFIVTAAPASYVEPLPPSYQITQSPVHPIAVSPPPELDARAHPPPPPPSFPLSAPALTVQLAELTGGELQLTIKLCKGLCDGAGFLHFLCGWAEMVRGKPQVSVLPMWGRPPIGVENSTTHGSGVVQVHLPRLQVQSRKSQPPQEQTDPFFIKEHPTNIQTMGEVLQLDLPNDIVSTMLATLYTEEDCSCTAPQALAAHVWRQRTQAFQFPPGQIVRLFFLAETEEGGGDEQHPKGHYGPLTFNCQATTTAYELLERPLSYAVRLIQAAEATLASDFAACWAEFGRLHARGCSAPLEVLLFTEIPKAAACPSPIMDQPIASHLDFGVLGRPSRIDHVPCTNTIQLPSQVNVAAVGRHPYQPDSMLHIIMNNVPSYLVHDIKSLLSSNYHSATHAASSKM